MPTVIDSLVVKLGLDPSGFKTGSDEAQKDLHLIIEVANRTGRQLEDSGKQGALFFSQLKNEALGLIGALVGATGLEQIVRRSTESMAQLGREAANLNVDPQKLAAFSMALERFGASGESTRQTLFGISQAVERFKLLGDPGILKYLQVIGAGPQNSSFEILQRFIAYAQAHKNQAAQVNLIGQGLGIDQSTINAALQIKSGAEFQKAYNDALRDAPTKQQVEQAQKLQTAWVALEQAAVGLANKMVTQLSPALAGVATWGTQIIHDNPQIIEAVTGVVTALTGLGALRLSAKMMGLTGIAEVIGGILSAMDGVLAALGALEIWRKATEIKGLNAGEDEWLDKWRKDHGLPYGDQRRAMEERQTAQYLRDHPNARLPEGGTGQITYPIPAPEANANRQAAEKYFLSQGYTPQQVAGILANMQAESSFNPKAEYKGHYGLFQWDGKRQQDFMRLFHHPIQQSTVQEQLQFAQWELTHTEKKAGDEMRDAKTSAQSGIVFSHDYERVGSDKADAFRGTLAEQYNVHPADRTRGAAPAAGSQSTTTVHIGHVTVNTKATDAHGIARDFGNEITVQANRGLV